MIVKTIQKGEATIYIHDDYCKDTTPEEVDMILKDIARIAYPALKAAHFKRLQKEETA